MFFTLQILHLFEEDNELRKNYTAVAYFIIIAMYHKTDD